MQNHTAELTRALDRSGVVQTVLTTRPPTAPYFQRLGDHACVIRMGFPIRRFRQLYAPQAAILALRTDVVHVHLGEDLAVIPLGAAAARLHRLPLVLTIHTSLRHTLVVSDLRSAVLKTLGGPIERWGALGRGSLGHNASLGCSSQTVLMRTAFTSSHRA